MYVLSKSGIDVMLTGSKVIKLYKDLPRLWQKETTANEHESTRIKNPQMAQIDADKGEHIIQFVCICVYSWIAHIYLHIL